MEKLYDMDSHLTLFTAWVTDCQAGDKGYWVALNRTAFFPGGGGQSADTGWLGGSRVTDMRETDGVIYHLCDKPLSGEVSGRIDFDKRFDQMQQHTGEHIVSGIVHRMFGYDNVGFHMGSDLVTMDFNGWIPEERLPQIEQEANEAVWKNSTVRCWYPSPKELAKISYRSKGGLTGAVRLVDMSGVDRCACCGSHVASTGEIGMVKIVSCVKFRKGARMELVCGNRALRYLSGIYEQARLASQALSAKVTEIGAAARQAQNRLEREKQRYAALQRRHFAAIANTGLTAALCFEPGLDSRELRQLCEAMVCPAAVFSGENGSYQMCLFGESAAALGKTLTESFHGRGGGRDGFFQGSLAATQAEIRGFFAAYYPQYREILE